MPKPSKYALPFCTMIDVTVSGALESHAESHGCAVVEDVEGECVQEGKHGGRDVGKGIFIFARSWNLSKAKARIVGGYNVVTSREQGDEISKLV
jgi:hypothetical protein